MTEKNRNKQDVLPFVLIGGVAVALVCIVGCIVVAVLGLGFGGIVAATADPSIVDEGIFEEFDNADPLATQTGRNDQLPPTLAPDVPTPIPPTPDAMQETLTRLDAIVIPSRDRLDLAQRLNGATNVPPVNPQAWEVGDTDLFYVSDDFGTNETTGELVYISEPVYAWVEQGQEYDAAALQTEIDRFAQEIVPVVLETFGGDTYPTPGEEPQFHIFHNTLMAPTTAGYYSSSSEWPAEAVQFSNERSMFMINLSNTSPGSFAYIDVLTHEFQHLIHWHIDLNEETWLNEGMSEVAPYLVGLGSSNFLSSYTNSPEIQITTWPEDATTLPHYGGGYLFSVYFLEQFGVEGIQALVANELNGMESVQAVLEELGSPLSAEEVFANWLVANYLNDSSVDPAYGYGTIEAEFGSLGLSQPDLADSLRARDYPYSREGANVRQYGAAYIELDSEGQTTITFDGSETLALIPTQTFNTDGDEATDDDTVWWSNRGDDSNMTLTRAFDLSDVEEATLTYDIWFLIEDRWDYGYIEVSTDDGDSWEILPTPYTTTDNPFGNAYGPGYTGASADFADANPLGWLSEEINLSPYAGQQILIRFEMVTDDAVNQPGFAVDNIRLDAVDFSDDVEAGDNGWEARGFVRHNNIIPQEFIVQVIVPGSDGITVEQMTLDEANAGTLTVDVGRQPAILIISGLGRHTTIPAIFDLTIEQ